MLLWIVLGALIVVPLIVHVRGGQIVALSLWTCATYALGAIVLFSTAGNRPVGDTISQGDTAQPCVSGLCQQSFQLETGVWILGVIPALFIVIAAIFWGLSRWSAPLPHDRLKTLFWLLHGSILALPFVGLVFNSLGIFDSYQQSGVGMPVFAVSSMIVFALFLISLAGLVLTMLGAVIKRLRM